MSKVPFLVREFFIACWDTIKLPFWLIGVGWKRLISFGPRRIGLVLFASAAVILFSLLLFVKATSQPSFCKSCHVMIPYFDAWETSTHSNVTCTECHIPPGIEGTVHSKFLALSMVTNYMTGLYKRSKPWAEIDDRSCLRSGCHDTRLLQGTEDFRGVTFDHKPHLENVRRGRQLRCTSCHANIVQGEHISVNESTCFLCHFKPDSVGTMTELSRCTHCHNPPTGTMAADTSFDHTEMLARGTDCSSCHASEIAGDGYVPRERCNSCHARQDHIERYDDHLFVHQMHVTDHKVECTACHIQIRHGKEAVALVSEERTCGECHGKPDNAVERVWRGELPGLPVSPSSMASAGMECNSCHVGEIHGEDRTAHKPACTPCHDASFDGLWPRWRESIDAGLRDLEKKLAGLSVADADAIRAAIDMYRRGNPLHNPELVDVLTARVTGSPAATGHACAVCHPGAANAVVSHDGKQFDHRKHAAAGDCITCHVSERTDQHGSIKLSANQCNSCHHAPLADIGADCGSCHTTQAAVFAGNVPEFSGAMPSFKVDLEVTCSDCHAVRGSSVSRDVLPSCVACHDAGIADTLAAWKFAAHTIAKEAQSAMSAYRAGSEPYKQYQQLADLLKRDGSSIAHNPELFKRWSESLKAAQ
ncbi:MAG: NapC/NirT family cytochrome c [Calditrichaeota bacterium]|nr:NapC/NirT family cytochrome c [Calditrichota bacterium]MCB9367076.1 NapC/NirT family cytochrome c [Calditrichota bacterium]MCB9391440.1 NapC/NirT family cytochrome c [Calditrichota bacterium]